MPDWHRFHAVERQPPEMVDPRRRLRLVRAAVVAALAVIFARAVQLEVTGGETFRREAAQPLRRERSLPGVRGRILARDGTVLACDREVLSVAVHYRWLQQPPDPRWLRYTARRRLTPEGRKDPAKVAAAEAEVRAQRDAVARRVAELCGTSIETWNARAARIQARVERITESVNRRAARARRRQDDQPAAPRRAETLPDQLGRFVWDALQSSARDGAPAKITVAEELDYHVVVDDVPLAVVAEIEGHPERYPGVRIVERSRRSYPAGTLAAHLLGYLGPVEPGELDAAAGASSSGDRPPGADARHPEDLLGRAGLERQYEHLLRGRRGTAVELTDRTGRVLSSYRRREPGVGRDLVLTVDASLQRAAESLLEAALARRDLDPAAGGPAGGAAIVMDIRRGAIRAAACAPRFDPNWFAAGRSDRITEAMDDPACPLFDRAVQMALPPGSVFKAVAAIALLESGNLDPREPLFCRGYLHEPDRQRCAVFIRHGVGHGEVNLADALAVSCNVYFFHHAEQLGAGPLVDWALRLGFGRPTGIDLPGEAAGMVPTPATIEALEGHRWRTGDTHALAIGQGSTTATPLQVARLMAAVANGGKLVTPHLVSRLGLPTLADGQTLAEDDLDARIRTPAPRPLESLRRQTLEAVRAGLARVVADPQGTAHGTVHLESIPIAGKTGTAETGGDHLPHAWFAGYVPADDPKFALVVVLEHSGDGGTSAGPVAKRLVLHMQQLGLIR